jgi:DNA-binding response OmpR family regulator
MRQANRLRILVVEDDLRMAELLRTGLAESGHRTLAAASAEEAQPLLDQLTFDAIVLDIGLPGRSGYTIAHHLRQRPNPPAIVMLTALNQEDQVVCGLEAGADDYLTKPFSLPELVARIASAVRRTRIAALDDLSFGPFQLDVQKHRLFLIRTDAGAEVRTEVHLARNEYLLLRALLLHRGEPVPRRQLLQSVWGARSISHGALDTLVNTLREKLNPGRQGLIATVRGIGYCLAEETACPGDIDAPQGTSHTLQGTSHTRSIA